MGKNLINKVVAAILPVGLHPQTCTCDSCLKALLKARRQRFESGEIESRRLIEETLGRIWGIYFSGPILWPLDCDKFDEIAVKLIQKLNKDLPEKQRDSVERILYRHWYFKTERPKQQ